MWFEFYEIQTRPSHKESSDDAKPDSTPVEIYPTTREKTGRTPIEGTTPTFGSSSLRIHRDG